jgi:peptidoglycan/xylan/chitin deacetylase (PgdA/CDA1 family)
LNMPPGKRFAVSLGPDFDAQSVWIGTFRSVSQSHMSRGEFGAMVGAPRLLEFYARYGIRTTWCVPTHTMQTFRQAVDAVVEAGHEIAAHGVWHEYVPKLELPEERRLIELQLDVHEQVIGKRPRGYRSPALDLTDNTLAVLEEYGFEWDSSLQGRDFEPYRPRLVVDVDREHGNTFGPPSGLLEIPVTWFLDDFPEFETFNGNAMMQSHDVVLRRWIDIFDYGYERCPGGVMTFTLHPQTIGRPHHMLMLERFVEHVLAHDGVWFPTLSELFDCWTDDAEGAADA